MVSAELQDAMNTTSGPIEHEVNEMDLAGLETSPSELVRPPRVKAAPIHLECVFHQEVKLPCTLEGSINTMIIGEVIGIHISNDVLVDGLIDLSLVKPLARLGYQQYTCVDNLFSLSVVQPVRLAVGFQQVPVLSAKTQY